MKILLATEGVNASLWGGDSGRSPLWFAALHGPDRVVKLLLAADGIFVDDSGEMPSNAPLVGATWGGHEAVVRLLWNAANPHTIYHRHSLTVLALAAWDGNTETVKFLLATDGIDPETFDSKGVRTLSCWLLQADTQGLWTLC